ncbi:hypothetical protein NECID01_1204 [Nematocida sp. AWRm77]|nr:hypothetical protein NECID01_1204 [Nematocida sp. AWRm77]
MQIAASDASSIIVLDALSKLPYLRSLEVVNGFLSVETVEYLLEKLPALECLSGGFKELDNKLAQALSMYAGMHMLKLRGRYTTGFLASLLQMSPLMNTLKVLDVYRYGKNTLVNRLSIEDKASKTIAMQNLGCAVQVSH